MNNKRFLSLLLGVSLLLSACTPGLEIPSPVPYAEKVAATGTPPPTAHPVPDPSPEPAENDDGDIEPTPDGDINDPVTSITISAAGDVTLGGDARLGQLDSFLAEMRDDDYSYYFRNVKPIFDASDISIVNLEGALTNHMEHSDKQFAFRGPPELVEVLKRGGVNTVTLANNHSRDYLTQGFDETVHTLRNAGITYFGFEFKTIKEVKGIKVGMFGYSIWDGGNANKTRITDAITQLKSNGADIVIAYFHWGVEGANYPSPYQRNIARHAIDEGAELILGAHPHVLQGIEEYNGRYIVYSLANFCFGGNRNPSDKDTMIFQKTFEFTDGVLTGGSYKIIPCSISSVPNRNNFQPTPLTGDDAARVTARIERYGNIDAYYAYLRRQEEQRQREEEEERRREEEERQRQEQETGQQPALPDIYNEGDATND
jgi:poly-gamma-glutamate synthesis protein (capsule biosynthesis protein)